MFYLACRGQGGKELYRDYNEMVQRRLSAASKFEIRMIDSSDGRQGAEAVMLSRSRRVCTTDRQAELGERRRRRSIVDN